MSDTLRPIVSNPPLGGAPTERQSHNHGSMQSVAHLPSPQPPSAVYPPAPQFNYPTSFPMYASRANCGSGDDHVAMAAPSTTPLGSQGSAVVNISLPSYPTYPGYGVYPQHSQQQQQHSQQQQQHSQQQQQHSQYQQQHSQYQQHPQQQQHSQHQQHPQQQQHPNPNAYIPHEPTREEVVNEAIAATSQHWVQLQLKREAEKRYQQRYGSAPPPAHYGREGQGGDGYARENTARPLPRAGNAGTKGGPVSSTFSQGTQRQHVEFLIGSPRHVGRLALLFLFTLFGVLPLMSAFAFTTVLCGVVLLYICDYLGYHRTTVFILLGTAGVFAVALFISNIHAAVTSFGPMLMIADLGGILMIAVATAIQHFRWMQGTFPNVLCVLERLVFAVGPVLCLPPLLTTTIGLLGSRYAPFSFLVVVCVLHHFFYCPLKSSFLVMVSPKSAADTSKASVPKNCQRKHREADDMDRVAARERVRVAGDGVDQAKGLHVGDDGVSGDDEETSVDSSASTHGVPLQLNERMEALVFSCLVVFLPCAVYNALQSNWQDNPLANILNSLGLICASIAYFCFSPVHSLWFLAVPADKTYSVTQQLEYDPLGLMDLVAAYRNYVLSSVSLIGVHWCTYRILMSRYSYLFSGVAFPFNAILLLIAFYIAVYIAIEIKRLLEMDSCGVNMTKGKCMLHRAPALLGSCALSVILCVLTSAPGVFYVPSVLSIMAFNLFLMDRTNGGPMFTFTVFTSLMLLWWMYRTYSFIVMDLRVFGEATVVPTPVLGVSVLWCYVLGCMSFTLSFSPKKAPVTVVLFLLALQVTFVEHVLYSQKDEGAYPAVFVALTSAVGVIVVCRMYANGVLTVYSAALISSCYVAKFFTFLVEVTSAYYAAELSVRDEMEAVRAWLLTVEITGGWWVALFAGYLVATFEIENRRRIKMEAAKRMLYTYASLALLLSLLTIRNVQRAAYEFVTQSYVSESELLHIATGTCCATYALLTMPVWSRLKSRYAAVFPLRSVSRCAALLAVVWLAVQPTRVLEDDASDFDYDFEYAKHGRIASVIGFIMLLGGRLSLLQCVPFAGRLVYWILSAASLALGITGVVQAVPSFTFYLTMLGLVFLVLLLVDVTHYRNVSGILIAVVYCLSVAMLPLTFLQLNRSIEAQQEKLGYSPDGLATLWDMYEQGSMRLLAVIVFIHLGLSVMINCRLSGRPLLPKCQVISHDAARFIGVVSNFSTGLTVTFLCSINFIANDSEPVMYVLSALLLLLLVDDELVFFGLTEHNFRYFPPTAYALAMLWMCAVRNAWSAAAYQGLFPQLIRETLALLQASVTLPAQISLLVLLWRGRKMGSSPGFVVVGSLLLNAACLLFVSDKAVQWMAIVGIFGQSARIFEAQLRPTAGSRRHFHSIH